MQASFRERLRGRDRLIGTIISLPAPEVAEVMAAAGFDWLFIDMEHSALDFQTTQRLIQAADSRTACIVRVPSPHEAWFKKCLDMGPSGVMIPQVNSVEQAKAVIKACKYPPLGQRSVGMARAHGYGMAFEEYVARANDETAIVIQIEHIDAVDQIEGIAKLDGIDALLIGPYDLSASLGKTGKFDDPQFRDAISRVEQCARAEGLPLGIFGANVAAVEDYVKSGYRLIAVGLDTMLLGESARAIVTSLGSG